MEKKEIFKILLALAALAVLSFWSVDGPKTDNNPAVKGEEKAVSKEPMLEWKELTPTGVGAPWAPRDSHETFIFQNKIWLIGGINGNGLVDKNHFIAYWIAPHFNDIWNSDDGINWTKIDSKNIWTPRRSMSIVFFKDKLWMFGGWSKAGGYVDDIWSSEDGVNWTRAKAKADFPPREGQTAEVFDGRIWMMGGVNYDKRKVFNDVWYTEDGIDWVEATPTGVGAPWSGRWDFALAAYKDKFYLIAGMDLTGKLYNDVWSSSDGINWMLETDSPPWQSRQGASAMNFKDRLWLIGRLNDSEYGGANDAWYTEDGRDWEKSGEDLPWDGREDFTTVVLNGKIYIMGGMANDWTWRNDVWEGILKLK